MKKKNKFLAPLISLLLIAAIGGGIAAYFITRPKDPVPVYSIQDCYLYSYYWDGGNNTDGIVTSDKLQTVYLSPSQEVTEVNVQMGQQVHVGDTLLTYDTTLSQITLERQRLDIERKKLLLEDYKKQLEAINRMKPISYNTTPTTKPTTTATRPVTNHPEESLPSSGYLVYGSHAGTNSDPLRVWVRSDYTLKSTDLASIMEKAKLVNAYLVVETREGNRNTGEVQNIIGLEVERVELNQEPKPTEPTEPTQPEPSTAPDENPIQGPSGGDETNPAPTEPVPSEPEPTESEPTEPLPTESEPEPTTLSAFLPFENLVRLANLESSQYVYVIRSVFPAKPLQNNPSVPATTPTTPSSNVNYNSGYTAAEITQMKKDKQDEIKELEFTIRMAESEYKIMQKEFDNGIVTSEIDGYVVAVLDPEEAMLNNQPVVKVSGGGGFNIQGSVSELKLDSIHIGDTVQIECWMSGITCEGTITNIGDFPVDQSGWYGDGNPNVSYYPFTVTIDGSENLQTGEYAQITYSTDTDEADSLYMQCAFLRNENGVYYAYVRDEDGLLEKRQLSVGQIIYNGEAIRIYSGLTMSDYVAFPYGPGLEDGVETVITSDMSALYGYDY